MLAPRRPSGSFPGGRRASFRQGEQWPLRQALDVFGNALTRMAARVQAAAQVILAISPIDKRGQDDIRCVLRSDTPAQARGEPFGAEDTSTSASAGTCVAEEEQIVTGRARRKRRRAPQL